jgi:hypothetical protein
MPHARRSEEVGSVAISYGNIGFFLRSAAHFEHEGVCAKRLFAVADR